MTIRLAADATILPYALYEQARQCETGELEPGAQEQYEPTGGSSMKLPRIFATLVLAAVATASVAQYPARPVRIIVPFAVGGTSDIAARIVAQKVSEQTSRSFVVENRTGAAGRIGYEAVAKSAGDGYTLAVTDTTYTMLPSLYANLPWDAENDLIAVTIFVQAPFVIIASPNAKAATLSELLAQARANPVKINYGSAGIGSVNHVVTEVFMREAHVEFTHVPYKGMGDALTGMLTGSVEVLITAMPTAVGQIKSGKVLALAVTSAKRSAALPDVPSVTETGVPFVASNWFGLTAPKGTPRETIDYLHREVVKVLLLPDVKERFAAQGAETSGISPDAFGKIMREDAKRWGDVIRATGIKAE
jgi:tripartite-type tricarboxylate transporter receptor subunit TctC